MGLKDFGSRTISWLRSHRFAGAGSYPPHIDDEGLINSDADSAEPENGSGDVQGDQLVVKTIQPAGKTESIEKLQAGFDKLIEKLHGINQHLNHQVSQHEDLMNRMEKFPELLESFPAIVENQKQLTEQLIEQLKAGFVKEEQFVDAVEKIPTETAKQTDALVDIDHQLAAAANTDVQMLENFNKFNDALEKLNQSTLGQTDGIMQMSKTFAASDRYLKYIISRQNKRFMWIFVTAIGACVLVTLILTGIILYIRR